MQIKPITQNKIQLTINQWMVHLLGFLILIGGLLALTYMMMDYTIICKEKQLNRASNCVLKRDIFNIYRSNTQLGELKGAFVGSAHSTKGGEVFYVNLVTTNGLVNLTGASSSGRSTKDDAAEAINAYISKGLDTQFKVPYSTPWWIYTIAVIVSLLGIGLLEIRNVTIECDRILKTIIITRKGFFRTDEKKLLFSDIERVVIQEYVGSKGSKSYRLAFELKDKSSLPLTSAYNLSLTKNEEMAKKLNDFILE